MLDKKQPYRLLIVDDDESEIKNYKDAIYLINEETDDLYLEPTICKSVSEGMEAISKSSFDGALIDLKLSSISTDSADSGNTLIKAIKGKLRYPVVVYSGFTQDLDPDIGDETCFFKIYKRTEKTAKDIFQEMITIHRMGIIKIIGREGIIDKYLNDIFWIYLAKTVGEWNGIEPDNLEKMILRYTISHLQEYLEIDDNGGFEKYHPCEMYIIPPIKNKPFTGNIIKSDEKHFIVLTPPCDLAQGKTKYAVIAEIEKIEMNYVMEQKNKIRRNDPEEIKNAKNTLMGLITNSNSLKYHFLPPCQSFKGGFINFQKIHYEKLKDIEDNYDMVASVSASYIKDIIARFSHYYSRQGQPDMDYNKILKYIIDL